MPLSQSASISSPSGGNGNRLGQRTRKKHKKLDAICEDMFNENHRVKMESNEGSCSKGVSMGDESELRRSSRVRRAPIILDSSPPPKKKQKGDKFRRKIGGVLVERLRGKRRLENEGVISSSGEEEEVGAWGTRLRARSKSVRGKRLKGNGDRPRGKRKLFEDPGEDDVAGISCVRDELEDKVLSLEGEKSRVVKTTGPGRVGDLSESEDESNDDHSGDEKLENDVDALIDAERKQETMDGSMPCLVEKESEVPTDILAKETQDIIDNNKESEQHEELPSMSKLVEDVENQRHETEVTVPPSNVVEDEGCDEVIKDSVAEIGVKHAEHEDEANAGNYDVNEVVLPGPRIKEGRRCGLCGGGTDGKPPKRLASDYNGSDHETYSGSSASEEINYDSWDGFGDEPGWLGKLLGPINDRYGIAGIWVHQLCAVWSPEVYFAGLGCLKNVRAALCRGRALKCTRCMRPGATLGCRVDRCPKTYHLPCARASGCIFDHRKFLIACADHRYLFQPHGSQYLQRIKKLKTRKLKLEIRKLSNDASRKDVEAEEKWMEKCGEDEEFLRREAKRLQRDLLRIAPVYIGGSHSEGENLFEGWESVAGLQDVIRCMKEVVILPLLYPEFFENMGITPPRGVLLHGYPGTGKTLVVRALIGACARGGKRIAYFARKGADCLGKYVGDAERQLRLLFQVAEKSQPSIIFFDEIDGLAPVRTRQQDQTHSSVVSTLLALMDGLKCRGSVIVIGATNRPDAIDPALRRPGRFDREIYFPLPSQNDRASILAVHTRKWPKPVAGPLLEWVATKTVGFAGADLQALCAQAAVIALKRNCCWQQILSCDGDNYVEGRRMKLPAFAVEERDWLEALYLASPPCSRREAGMAANEVLSSPLHIHLIPCFLQPLFSLIISLYLDDRLWLPPRLNYAGAAIKKALVLTLQKRTIQSDRWWCHAPSMILESETAKEIVRTLYLAGIVDGLASFSGYNLSYDGSFDDCRTCPINVDGGSAGLFRNLCNVQLKNAGYRILIAGDPRSGQKHLASCLLHCFVGSIEIQKIDIATILQEGHGDMEEGISRILMKCANVKLCAIFMPRIDLWAIQKVQKESEGSPNDGSLNGSSSISSQIDGEECSFLSCNSELMEIAGPHAEVWNASKTWNSFIEQLECICVPSSVILLATSEIPNAALPHEIHQFFGRDSSLSEGSFTLDHATPRFTVVVDGEFDQDLLIHSSATDLSRDLVQQFIHLVHNRKHAQAHSSPVSRAHSEVERDTCNQRTDLKLVEDARATKQFPEVSVVKTMFSLDSRIGKGKSTLALAISTFGYQILRYPHFNELCWVTSKLKEGPCADVRGPWKGWPFNSCVVRPCKSMQKETIAWNSTNKGKEKFTLVRGLAAIGLSAYRGTYTSLTEVCLEVRKVLQLLVTQISARIQSGKDRYIFIRLLSQVAYLEDMVNNWAHSLRSLEPDPLTRTVTFTGAQSPENQRSPASNILQVEEQPSIQDGGLMESEVFQNGMHGSDGFGPACLNPDAVDVGGDNMFEASNLNETSPKKLAFSSHLDAKIHVSRVGPNLEEGSPENEVSASVSVLSTDLKSSSVDQTCLLVSNESNAKHEALGTNDLEHHPVNVEEIQFTQPLNQSASVESPDQLRVATCNSGNLGAVEISGSADCNGSNTRKHMETEISAGPVKQTGDAYVPDFNLSSENSDLSLESKGVCSYSCCPGCMYTLHQLMTKIVSQEWESSDSCNTVEDIHDLVSSLSSTLCSTVGNFYSSGNHSSSFNEQQKCEPYAKLFKSQEMNACQCESSEDKFTMLMECACHHTKDVPQEVNPMFFVQVGSIPTYVFRDGVLISADPEMEVALHCKYETFCLCSLLKLMITTRQPLE